MVWAAVSLGRAVLELNMACTSVIWQAGSSRHRGTRICTSLGDEVAASGEASVCGWKRAEVVVQGLLEEPKGRQCVQIEPQAGPGRHQAWSQEALG